MLLMVLKNIFNKISIFLPDKIFLKIKFRYHFGYRLDLNNPKSYNEKLQWLKIYNRNPLYTKLVDKYEVRKYIAETIGEEYLIPLIGVYDNVEEIDWPKLPKQFVLKCTHGSGANIICKDKDKLNIQKAKKQLKKWMRRNWYWYGREWPYKNVKPRIICEKFLQEADGEQIKDYRIFCFNGVPKFITVDFDIINKKNTRRNLYDLDWNLLDYGISYPRELSIKVERPKRIDEMIKISKILAKDKPHVRVDFYCLDTKIYFGEMTFYHQSGYGKVYPESFGRKIGDWIKLPNNN
jgi:hypothetical protein